MPEQTKRRRLSLYSLPIVVAIGFLLVAKLAAWQQSDLVADLADCIARGETREASEAVHKLAAMPNPPLAILVTAAAADEHETAEAGQVAISKLLRRWQRDIERKHRVGMVASQLCELAESLDKQQADFANADHPWLAITAGKILRLANSLPANSTPLVAIYCDAILALAESGGSASVSTAIASDTRSARNEKAEGASVTPATLPADRESNKANLDREISAYGPQGDLKDSAVKNAVTPNTLRDSATSGGTESASKLHGDAAGGNSESQPGGGSPNGSDKPKEDELSLHAPSPPKPLPDSEWGRPIFRILSAKPADASPSDAGAETKVGPGPRSPAQSLRVPANDPFGSLETRELLRRWNAAEEGDFAPIERELARRGFGKINPRLVRQFFSDDAEQRMRIVDDVLAQPGAGAAAWLLLLAEDPDAEVRLFAVTLMATSNETALVEKAWQVSIRDRDPRIADLAGRLRERRTGTLRR